MSIISSILSVRLEELVAIAYDNKEYFIFITSFTLTDFILF